MKIDDIKIKADAFQKAETFTFIQEQINEFKTFAYNGFIISIDENFLTFYDIITKREFPIIFSKILTLEYSNRKDLTLEAAKEVFNNYKNTLKKHGI